MNIAFKELNNGKSLVGNKIMVELHLTESKKWKMRKIKTHSFKSNNEEGKG